MAAPGTYTVEVASWFQGELTTLTEPVSFEVTPLGMSGLSAADQAAAMAFNRQLGELQRVAMGAGAAADDAGDQLDMIEQAVRRHPQVDLALITEVQALQLRLRDLQEEMAGDPTKRRRSESEMPGLMSRIQNAVGGAWSTSLGATQTHREQYAIAAAQLEALLPRLRTLVEQDLPALHARLEEAGVPWTPGRGVPRWQR